MKYEVSIGRLNWHRLSYPDGLTFEAIEEAGLDDLLSRIRNELVLNTSQPMGNKMKKYPRERER
jgi:hypothetical protein